MSDSYFQNIAKVLQTRVHGSDYLYNFLTRKKITSDTFNRRVTTPSQRDDLVDAVRFGGLSADMIIFDDVVQTNQTKEIKKMRNLQLSDRVLLNGHNADGMSDDELYDIIAEAEADIDQMGAIKNKPKKLEAKIEARQVQISKLVSYIDGRVDEAA